MLSVLHAVLPALLGLPFKTIIFIAKTSFETVDPSVFRSKNDDLVKSHFNAWIPAFAGMTDSISD